MISLREPSNKQAWEVDLSLLSAMVFIRDIERDAGLPVLSPDMSGTSPL
jgi:hypothetical protein